MNDSSLNTCIILDTSTGETSPRTFFTTPATTPGGGSTVTGNTLLFIWLST